MCSVASIRGSTIRVSGEKVRGFTGDGSHLVMSIEVICTHVRDLKAVLTGLTMHVATLYATFHDIKR